MAITRWIVGTLLLAALVVSSAWAQDAGPKVDLSAYAEDCQVEVARSGHDLGLAWPINEREHGVLLLDLRPGKPLIQLIGIAAGAKDEATPLLERVDPVTFLTIGIRQAPQGRPPEMPIWNVFFDKPASRPYQTHRSQLDLKRVAVAGKGGRASVTIGDLTVGPFTGELVITLYALARLVHVEAVVSTSEDQRAILYDAGLVGGNAGWKRMLWKDSQDRLEQENVADDTKARPQAVRYRALVAENERGSVACFPPPHQYQFPRDWTDNLKFTWFGRGYGGGATPFGLGIRQVPDGGRAFEPWFNAPPGTKQRLGVFYVLSRGDAGQALEETLRYTRGDKFASLPGHLTFTSHYHMAVAVTAQERKDDIEPEFKQVFKDMGVQAIHLGDFHGDGHPKDTGQLRLSEMQWMFRECERLSDDEFLLLPGEEINEYLGLAQPGKHPGHWMSFFSRPVYWFQKRNADQPFAEQIPGYGRVYRVNSREEMVKLIEAEQALVWAAHPRIKASSWTPDIFRHEDFYLADSWVGGAWKAMPADLSREKLGERVLDLMDDMANWGQKKYVLGEVDVFKIDHTHELFGHMNVNYLRLDKLPKYADGWMPILDALQHGRFFVTTGEILIPEFTVGGKQSGEEFSMSAGGSKPELRLSLEWTFPLKFVEIVSGDGQRVYRERIDMAGTPAFGKKTLIVAPELSGRTWVRAEAWDVAANGAFTQPVWIARK